MIAIQGDIKAVVLAGGLGKRLTTDGGGDAAAPIPKAMRQASGKPLLRYVLDALDFLPREDIIIVVGYGRERVLRAFPEYAYAVQEQQLGTGHAALCAEAALAGYDGTLIVCYGDMPLVRRESYTELVLLHREEGNDCTILSSASDIPLPFGRIVRSADGKFLKITETSDCTPEELLITELNSGVYVFSAKKLFPALHRLSNQNSQGEYYLTDALAGIKNSGGRVGVYKKDMREEIIGVNTPEDLAEVERLLALRGRD
ncbi:MAG: NTP transferase domain-containing protein [Oscillospiraceae bacterium]|jgi:bifunctional UDP-N-acetylglucosamine pyrophosphorylase/glucosamine-1-phosphate N-acetyltransferase/UDP-N-acetylglucosamine pyrophosphorylase|nr:NTP transferase domain-containing protein [Oscillospiraceae bacterium]